MSGGPADQVAPALFWRNDKMPTATVAAASPLPVSVHIVMNAVTATAAWIVGFTGLGG